MSVGHLKCTCMKQNINKKAQWNWPMEIVRNVTVLILNCFFIRSETSSTSLQWVKLNPPPRLFLAAMFRKKSPPVSVINFTQKVPNHGRLFTAANSHHCFQEVVKDPETLGILNWKHEKDHEQTLHSLYKPTHTRQHQCSALMQCCCCDRNSTFGCVTCVSLSWQ